MFRKLLLKIGLNAVGGLLRDVAAGKKGPGPQRVYLWLQGKKTPIGFALGACAAVLAAFVDEAAQYSGILATVAAFLVSIGLADKAWRAVPPGWNTRGLWIALRKWWPDIVVLLGAATASLTSCSAELAATLARFGLTCSSGLVIVTAVTAFGGWAIAEARVAEPPVESTVR